MWFKLNTTFTQSLGTLSSLSNSWSITRNLTNFSTTSTVTSVAKNGSYSATFKLNSGCTYSSHSVTMGGATVTTGVSYSNGTLTVSISKVTGAVVITAVATGTSSGGSGGTNPPVTPPSTTIPTLVQGYISGDSVNNELNTRVRINGLVSGAFSIECNSGYLIRAIQECASTTPSASDTNIVISNDKKTSYSGGSAGKYYAITFCKTDASANISPTESIIKSFSGTIVPITTSSSGGDSGSTTNPEAGTDVPYTLIQGAHVQNDSSIYNAPNRVTTSVAIKGKFTVTVNDGYVIRAVYEYAKASGDRAGVMVSETSTTKTTFTSTNANKYYGVTFTKSGDNANDNITPTEDIVKSWKYV